MTGARRFSLSSPDWGQAHLTLDAIVAYVDDELSPVAHARAQAHLECCGECRAEVVAQRQARTALRGAGGPNLPSSLLHSLRSIPVEAELPPMPPGLGVTADGQFVLLRDVPQAAPGPCPIPHVPVPHVLLPPVMPTCLRPVSVPARPRRRGGSPAGRASVPCRGWPWARWPSARWPRRPARRSPRRRPGRSGVPCSNLPGRLTPPSSDVPAGPELATAADATSTRPTVAPAVLDAQLRARLNRIPAAFRPEPEPLGSPLGYPATLGYPSRQATPSATRTSPLLRQAER